jgi:type IV secretion system protein VirB8
MSTAMAPNGPPNDAPLPVSKGALKKIAEAASWAEDDELKRSQSTSLAWKLVIASVLLALMGWGMALFQSMRPTPAPPTIVVDRTTGEVMVVGSFDESSVPQLSPLDQHQAATYVRSCEGYYFNLLKTDYDQCARMSTPEVFAPYSAKFQGDAAKQSVVGAKEEDHVTIVSVRMTSDTTPGRSGEAIVTYDKEITNSQGLPPSLARFVATVRFEYRPKAMVSPVDRLENPFGFVVLAYRTDQELVTPTTAPATKAPNAGSKS